MELNANKIIIFSVSIYAVIFIIFLIILGSQKGGDVSGNTFSHGLAYLLYGSLFLIVAICLLIYHLSIFKNVTIPVLKLVSFLPILMLFAMVLRPFLPSKSLPKTKYSCDIQFKTNKNIEHFTFENISQYSKMTSPNYTYFDDLNNAYMNYLGINVPVYKNEDLAFSLNYKELVFENIPIEFHQKLKGQNNYGPWVKINKNNADSIQFHYRTRLRFEPNY